jgi:hypothetical protein
VATYTLVLVFALWFGVSVLNQLEATGYPAARRIALVVKSLDLFSLIPTWNFFAPNPGTNDYHLLYRERLDDGAYGVWREVPFPKQSGLLKLVWNPRKRRAKVLSDVVVSLGSAVAEARQTALEQLGPWGDEDARVVEREGLARDRRREYETELARLIAEELEPLKLSIPYLIVLNYLSGLAHSPFSHSIQFLFAQTAGFDPRAEPEILYVSEPHELAS